MSKDKAKKGQDNRTPASKLHLDFLQANQLVIIVDEVSISVADATKSLCVVAKRPRVSVFYKDQLKTKETETNGKPKIDIVN